jgi:hypothetical protein
VYKRRATITSYHPLHMLCQRSWPLSILRLLCVRSSSRPTYHAPQHSCSFRQHFVFVMCMCAHEVLPERTTVQRSTPRQLQRSCVLARLPIWHSSVLRDLFRPHQAQALVLAMVSSSTLSLRSTPRGTHATLPLHPRYHASNYKLRFTKSAWLA